MFPSTFSGGAAPVQPLEEVEDNHFHGPRGLQFQKRAAGRERRGLADELGVQGGYQVISEVDLAFKPTFEDGVGVTVFQVKYSRRTVVGDVFWSGGQMVQTVLKALCADL